VLNGRFPAGEKILVKRIEDAFSYAKRILQDRFELFENIASSNTLFEIDFNINFNTQLLWEIIFQKEFYILNNYYNIIIQDYELTI
jgi:hypothetical protein